MSIQTLLSDDEIFPISDGIKAVDEYPMSRNSPTFKSKDARTGDGRCLSLREKYNFVNTKSRIVR